jgi:hypothetical protein
MSTTVSQPESSLKRPRSDLGLVAAFVVTVIAAFVSVFWLVEHQVLSDETSTWIAVAVSLSAVAIAVAGGLLDFFGERRLLRLLRELDAKEVSSSRRPPS